MTPAPVVEYQSHPERYRHWTLAVQGAVATLTLGVDEDGGIAPGYQLKLNSYDLGVDIELADAVNRIRFEHPAVRCVVITSARERVFCSGANIFMLGLSSHAWKVNFCKFTNETRNGLEDSSQHDGLHFLAAVNGACAGGGYELALACDEIVLVDDHSSAVSLPEVALLGVLPGTGGLTRLTDKRRVRHDLADLFCTSVEGVRGQKACDWRLVDHAPKPTVFAQVVQARALALAATSDRSVGVPAVLLPPLQREVTADGLRYGLVQVEIDPAGRCARWTLHGPTGAQPADLAAVEAAGAAWYPLQLARELDDAILTMRSNQPLIGTWLLHTRGDAAAAPALLALDALLLAYRSHGVVRQTIGHLRRTFSRLDVSSRSLFACITPGSCFAGTLFELALACDRIYHLALPGDEAGAPALRLSEANALLYPMASAQTRLARRFHEEAAPLDAVRAVWGLPLRAEQALALGLVTRAPDDIDWADELRIAVEERAALSPDALTGLEANLRFGGPENLATRVFGRLTAWQNWIFQRPNAVGERGALKVYGTGEKAGFDWTRI